MYGNACIGLSLLGCIRTYSILCCGEVAFVCAICIYFLHRSCKLGAVEAGNASFNVEEMAAWLEEKAEHLEDVGDAQGDQLCRCAGMHYIACGTVARTLALRGSDCFRKKKHSTFAATSGNLLLGCHWRGSLAARV